MNRAGGPRMGFGPPWRERRARDREWAAKFPPRVTFGEAIMDLSSYLRRSFIAGVVVVSEFVFATVRQRIT